MSHHGHFKYGFPIADCFQSHKIAGNIGTDRDQAFWISVTSGNNVVHTVVSV